MQDQRIETIIGNAVRPDVLRATNLAAAHDLVIIRGNEGATGFRMNAGHQIHLTHHVVVSVSSLPRATLTPALELVAAVSDLKRRTGCDGFGRTVIETFWRAGMWWCS